MDFVFWGKRPAKPSEVSGPEPIPAHPGVLAEPARAPDRPALRRITNPIELPKWIRVRSGDQGDVPVSEADRRFIGVVARLDKTSLLFYVPSTGAGAALGAMEARLRDMGEAAPQRIQVTPEILALVYDDTRTDADRSEVVTESSQAKLLDELLAIAIARDASDMHVQVNPERTAILLRIHGDLHVERFLSGSRGQDFARAIFRFAEVSEVDFNPDDYQDAMIARTIVSGGDTHELQLRFADMPVYPRGFDCTMRILRTNEQGTVRSLEDLGYSQAQRDAYAHMLGFPTGIVVMCGKTNSGKSTTNATLASMLHGAGGGKKLIRTIEDPPEYVIAGARQTPVVRHKDGSSVGFAKALRAAMRGDPDIIIVGEVRDEETARLAMEAVMTGHKVLTTVHAASPFDAVDRLIDKGFRRQILAADKILNGAVYQRLVKVLCPECAVPIPGDETVVPFGEEDGFDKALIQRIKSAPIEDWRKVRFRNERGCEACHGTGVIGRSVAAEVLVPDREIQSHILADDRVTAHAYWRAHRWQGKLAANGITALEQGIEKMGQGVMSPIDVETELGLLDSETDRGQATEWLEKRRHELRSVR